MRDSMYKSRAVARVRFVLATMCDVADDEVVWLGSFEVYLSCNYYLHDPASLAQATTCPVGRR